MIPCMSRIRERSLLDPRDREHGRIRAGKVEGPSIRRHGEPVMG
jgi:hypothetical protein